MSTVRKTQSLILSIEELRDHWKMLNTKGIRYLYITETFPKHGSRSFIVKDLTMDLDNKFATCSDCNNVLLDNYSPMCMFCKEHLTRIEVISDIIEVLEFSGYGIVLIKKTN
jgi:hypothetical protein